MAAQGHMRANGGDLRDVIALEDPLCGPAVAGVKAANLSLAAHAGLPIIPGFVITTAAAGDPMRVLASEALVSAWQDLSDDGRRSLVVRSSSVAEDIAESSMAGMFTSVVDVTGWEEFVGAVSVVLDSAGNALLGGAAQPMAVLVQHFIDAPVGGIMFGMDPVSGRRDRLVVVAAEGPPEALVSGRATGVHYLLGMRGRVAERHGDEIRLVRKQRTALANLARRASRTFGGPQDIEWAFDGTGHMWMLQSRPITAAASIPDPRSRLFGTSDRRDLPRPAHASREGSLDRATEARAAERARCRRRDAPETDPRIRSGPVDRGARRRRPRLARDRPRVPVTAEAARSETGPPSLDGKLARRSHARLPSAHGGRPPLSGTGGAASGALVARALERSTHESHPENHRDARVPARAGDPCRDTDDAR